MNPINNERGSVLIFVTLLIVLLLVMVGMGLDTGHLVYVRAQGQAAVDAAALAAASAIPTRSSTQVNDRASAFNSSSTNGKNDYVGSDVNPITDTNVTYVQYNSTNGAITTSGVTIDNANGVRVALESKNPHTGATPGTAMISRLFLMPLLNLFGHQVDSTADVSVSAVAVLKGKPDLPVALKTCNEGAMSLILQPDSKSQQTGSENACWTTFTVSPSKEPTIESMVRSGCGIPLVGKGTPIDLANGGVTPILTAITQEYGPFSNPSNKCFIIPVIAQTASCSEPKQTVEIDSFAKICITHIEETGGDKRIDADVTCNVELTGTATRCSVPVLVRDTTSGM
jgi:Flp pilus assembly protein TadG